MKFGQSKEYSIINTFSIINIFTEKSYKRCGGEASPRPFYKMSKLSIYLWIKSEMLQICFTIYQLP